MEPTYAQLEARVRALETDIQGMKSQNTVPLSIDRGMRARLFDNYIHSTPTLDFPDTGIQGSSTVTTTVAGASIGDMVVVSPPVEAIVGTLGGIFVGYVTAKDTVTVKFINPDDGSTINPGSGVFNVMVIRKI